MTNDRKALLSRQQRLEAALKANIRRRKEKARAIAEAESMGDLPCDGQRPTRDGAQMEDRSR